MIRYLTFDLYSSAPLVSGAVGKIPKIAVRNFKISKAKLVN